MAGFIRSISNSFVLCFNEHQSYLDKTYRSPFHCHIAGLGIFVFDISIKFLCTLIRIMLSRTFWLWRKQLRCMRQLICTVRWVLHRLACSDAGWIDFLSSDVSSCRWSLMRQRSIFCRRETWSFISRCLFSSFIFWSYFIIRFRPHSMRLIFKPKSDEKMWHIHRCERKLCEWWVTPRHCCRWMGGGSSWCVLHHESAVPMSHTSLAVSSKIRDSLRPSAFDKFICRVVDTRHSHVFWLCLFSP